MLDNIRGEIEQGRYENALELISQIPESDQQDVQLHILKCTIYYFLNQREKMFESIQEGMKLSPCNYELFYLLGISYLERNINQAYLAFQNALFFCKQPNVQKQLQNMLTEIKNANKIEVRNTAIVIVSYNSCYLLTKTIESIRNTIPANTYRIIVVDNDSTDSCVEYLKSQSDITLYCNSENKGFACACNQGCRDVIDEDIFLLNNDTRLAYNSLFWLKMGLYKNQNIGACGSISNYAGNLQQIEKDFPLPNDYLEFASSINVLLAQPYEERVRLSGFAMLIRHGLWSQVGGMDEIFSPGYFEDDDLCMKIRSNGLKLLLCKNSFIYHAGSQSFSTRDDINELLQTNHKKFVQKYGFDILDYAYPNSDLLSQIPYLACDSFNILFLGSGLNANCMAIKEQYSHANILSIEPNEKLYQIVKSDATIFPSIAALRSKIQQPIFHVLVINHHCLHHFEKFALHSLTDLCLPECLFLHINREH